MNSKKARFEEIRSIRSVARIRVVNIRRDRFAPDPRQLKIYDRGSGPAQYCGADVNNAHPLTTNILLAFLYVCCEITYCE